MFEIDKNAFGEFLAQQRKAKGYTQKDLADKLYVSDKAVSKWERALSMPDISLLMPLAEILDVSVTELLEGRKLDDSSEMDTSQVEILVQKALSLSEDTPEKKKARIKKHAAIFGGCTLLTLLELAAGLWFPHGFEATSLSSSLLVLELLILIFGIYFWFFMKERLPAYYDENKISAISDGIFRMNVPGVHFNNHNWLPIVKYLRAWSAVALVAIPLPCILLSALNLGFWWYFCIQNIVLAAFLGGLFVPVYIIGRKYENSDNR
ncbi:MAG: helix-turn-helix domain-containing protein [Candidatus Gastranaerophilales bacterium]|nr:helix-turn-helix domain-containing protein [Candidatus Gastranaerophilales bacterium]